MEIITKAKVRKSGNAYVATVPKQYVDDGLIDLGDEVEVTIPLNFKRQNSNKESTVPTTMGPSSSLGRGEGLLPRPDHALQMKVLDDEINFCTKARSQLWGYVALN